MPVSRKEERLVEVSPLLFNTLAVLARFRFQFSDDFNIQINPIGLYLECIQISFSKNREKDDLHKLSWTEKPGCFFFFQLFSPSASVKIF